MPRDASELAHRLAREAEAVCRHYLSNGKREGRYWLVGDVNNSPGRSMFVRLQDSPKGMAISSTSSAEALGFATSVRLPRRRGAFSSCHALNRKNSFQDQLVPQCRPDHKRPQDGSLKFQVLLRAPSLRRTCSAVEYCTCTTVAACASIRAAIIGLTSTCRPKPGRR